MKNQIKEQICFLIFLFGAKIISAQNDFEPDVEDSSFGNFFSTYVNFFLDTLNFKDGFVTFCWVQHIQNSIVMMKIAELFYWLFH